MLIHILEQSFDFCPCLLSVQICFPKDVSVEHTSVPRSIGSSVFSSVSQTRDLLPHQEQDQRAVQRGECSLYTLGYNTCMLCVTFCKQHCVDVDSLTLPPVCVWICSASQRTVAPTQQTHSGPPARQCEDRHRTLPEEESSPSQRWGVKRHIELQEQLIEAKRVCLDQEGPITPEPGSPNSGHLPCPSEEEEGRVTVDTDDVINVVTVDSLQGHGNHGDLSPEPTSEVEVDILEVEAEEGTTGPQAAAIVPVRGWETDQETRSRVALMDDDEDEEVEVEVEEDVEVEEEVDIGVDEEVDIGVDEEVDIDVDEKVDIGVDEEVNVDGDSEGGFGWAGSPEVHVLVSPTTPGLPAHHYSPRKDTRAAIRRSVTGAPTSHRGSEVNLGSTGSWEEEEEEEEDDEEVEVDVTGGCSPGAKA